MFWQKAKAVNITGETVAEQVAAEAEALYRSGKMHCAEAVVAAIKNKFRPDLPVGVVGLAAGFGGGSGTGCICGAVSGGTMALGLVLQDDTRSVKKLTRSLHKWFKEEYGATCCKVILETRGKVCPTLTGRVAGKVAEMLGKDER